MFKEPIKASFDGLHHKYIIKNGSQVMVRKACEEDIPGILKIYEAIKIDPLNIGVKLIADHENSFMNRGGFFETLSGQEIGELLKCEDDIFLVSVIPGAEVEVVNSCLYCRINTDTFSNMDWKLNESGLSASKKREFVSALNKGKVFTAMEHAILPVVQSRGVAYPVIYEMYRRLAEVGFLFVMLQIYTITGVKSLNENIPLYLPNMRSRILNEKLGAVLVGTNSIEPKRVGDKELEIKSNVYSIEVKNAVEILEGKVIPAKYIDNKKVSVDSK